MKLLSPIVVVLCLFAIKAEAATSEAEWYNTISVCQYFDDLDETEKFKACTSCINSAFPSKSSSVTNEELKKCTDKMPPKFTACGSQATTKLCVNLQLIAYRQESQTLFQKLHKEVLTHGEIARWTQIWGAFLLFFSMAKELPLKATNRVIETSKICFDPIQTDLSQFEEQRTDAMFQGEEETRNVRATEDDNAKIVKNTYRRVYRVYLCCVQKLTEDKETKSMFVDFLQTYDGIVPAKVARLFCEK